VTQFINIKKWREGLGWFLCRGGREYYTPKTDDPTAILFQQLAHGKFHIDVINHPRKERRNADFVITGG